jgi:hypothetical protein
MKHNKNNWLDKYIPEAQNGIEGTMGGLTDIGFNYNGAWGGTMQGGGNLPGSVGFTYARTQSPAPSNGKYAKKTKASAQNGREMQFYQNGLDFVPKTISKNGGWLNKFEEGGIIEDDMGQWNHPGEITKINSNQITMEGVPYPVMGISDTGDTQMMYPEEDYEFDGESVTEYPMMEKAEDGITTKKKFNLKDPVANTKSLQDNVRVAKQPMLKNPFLMDPLTGQPVASKDRAELLKTAMGATRNQGTVHTPYKKSVREDIIDLANQIDRQGENPVAGIVTEPVKAAMRLMRADKNFDLSSSNSADIARAIGEGALQTGMDALTVAPIAAEAAPFIKGVGKTAIKNVTKTPSINALSKLNNRKVLNIPKTNLELLSTNFKKDKFFNKEVFDIKKAESINRLSTPEGKRRLQSFIDENYKLNPEKFSTQINPSKNPFSFFKNIFNTNKKFTPDDIIKSAEDMQFDTLKGELAYDNTNAYHWFKDGINKPSVMAIGEGNSPYDALHIFEHELGHLMQRGAPSNLDKGLSKLTLNNRREPSFNLMKNPDVLSDPGYSTSFSNLNMIDFDENLDYFIRGSAGQEKYPFAAEVRENLLQKKLINDVYDEITPELLMEHKNMYRNTRGNRYPLRLYEIMQDDPNNFKILSDVLNKMPQVALPVALGAGAVALQEKKNGGQVNWLENYK